MQSFKSDGLTINNNYNNNTISIIDGNTITTTSGSANGQQQQSKIGSGIINPIDITAKDMAFAMPASEGASLQKDRSGMLPKLAQAMQVNSADTAKGHSDA